VKLLSSLIGKRIVKLSYEGDRKEATKVIMHFDNGDVLYLSGDPHIDFILFDGEKHDRE
jgi:hypothetical protein